MNLFVRLPASLILRFLFRSFSCELIDNLVVLFECWIRSSLDLWGQKVVWFVYLEVSTWYVFS